MGHGGEGTVRMHHRDALPYKHTAQQRQAVEAGGDGRLVVHHLEGQVVHLEPIGQVANPCPVAISMGGHNHLVPFLNETLGELVYVALHSPHIRIEEVRHHANVVFGMSAESGRSGGDVGAFACGGEVHSHPSSSLAHSGGYRWDYVRPSFKR